MDASNSDARMMASGVSAILLIIGCVELHPGPATTQATLPPEDQQCWGLVATGSRDSGTFELFSIVAIIAGFSFAAWKFMTTLHKLRLKKSTILTITCIIALFSMNRTDQVMGSSKLHPGDSSLDPTSSTSHLLARSVVEALLMISGVNPNPGPTSGLTPSTTRDFIWHSDWKVSTPAQANPGLPANIPSQRAVEQYIAREFTCLTNQQGGVISVPEAFPASPKLTYGERAEMAVFGAIKKAAAKIPHLKIVFFNGLTYSGEKLGTNGKVIREMDISMFLEHQGKHYSAVLEVKCCDREQGLGGHRKKAHGQLTTYTSILQQEHGVSAADAAKVQLHTVWPNLTRWEPYPPCGGSHLRFQPKPPACLQPGTQPAQYEPQGWHIFMEDMVDVVFQAILQSFLDPRHEMPEAGWMKALQVHTQLACGALYDEFQKEFVLLGQDQLNLVHHPEHDLSQPILVEGLAGTGKSLTMAVKMEALQQQGKLGPTSRALYIAFSDHMLEHMKQMLRIGGVDMTYIELRNASTDPLYKDFLTDQAKMNQVTSTVKFIFMDEAEDLGHATLESLGSSTLTPGVIGFFMVAFDFHQCRHEKHSLEAAKFGALSIQDMKWKGRALDRTKMGNRVRSLKTVFRNTENISSHIEKNHLIPDLRISGATGHVMKHNIQGLDCTIDHIDIKDPVTIEIVVQNKIENKVKSMTDGNLHPGHVAFLFPDDDYQLIFGSRVSGFIGKLKQSIGSKYAKMKNVLHPVFTTSLHESLFFHHTADIKHCSCKVYLGSIDSVKGLTIRVVHYFPLTPAPPDPSAPPTSPRCMERTWPHYGAASRASCQLHVTELRLPDPLPASTPVEWRQHVTNLLAPIPGPTAVAIPERNYATHPTLPATAASLLQGHTQRVECLAWGPGGELATGGWDKRVMVWASDGSKVELACSSWVYCLDWSTGGLVAAGCEGGEGGVWRSTGERVATLQGHSKTIYAIQFSPSGQSLLTGSKDRTCRVWSPHTGACLQEVNCGGQVNTVAWRDDTTFLAGSYDGTIAQWTVGDKTKAAVEMKGHKDWVNSISWNPTSRLLASGGEDHLVMVWAPDSQTPLARLPGHQAKVCEVVWSPGDQDVLASWDWGGEVRVWSIAGRSCLHTLQTDKDSPATYIWQTNQISFSPDGLLLASRGQEVKVWRVATGEVPAVCQMEGGRVAWSREGDRLAVLTEEGKKFKNISLFNM